MARLTIEKINTVLHRHSLFHHPKTAAVILAGGAGSRFSPATKKQLAMVMGKEVLAHTLCAFEQCRCIDEIVVVADRDTEADVKQIINRERIRKCRVVVPGGETRADSARAGYFAVSPGMKYVAFHDAARCLITPKMIGDVANAAYAYGAATASCTVVDTVKRVNRYGFVSEGLNRAELRQVQTPQIFHTVYYRAALAAFDRDPVEITDDNALMERIGQRVKAVDTGRENFKITYPEDLARAEWILRAREKQHD